MIVMRAIVKIWATADGTKFIRAGEDAAMMAGKAVDAPAAVVIDIPTTPSFFRTFLSMMNNGDINR